MTLARQPRIRRLPPNRLGRDFVTSPIGGQFEALERALAAAGFDPGKDRLIGVGNLIGSAPTSIDVTQWLGEQRIVSVLGEEEAGILEWANSDLAGRTLVDRIALHASRGARWLLSTAAPHLAHCVLHLREMPLLIEVALPDGRRVGLTHGEVPLTLSWEGLHAALEREDVRLQVVFGNRRPLALARARRENRPTPTRVARVAGIDALVAAGRAASFDIGNTHYLAPDAEGRPQVIALERLIERAIPAPPATSPRPPRKVTIRSRAP